MYWSVRFQPFPVAQVCDIAEMYLRIGILPTCRPFHRFWWRDVDQSRPPDVYQFNSLVFGVNSCPYQAQFVSRKHARENQEHYPIAAETILESTYMDDSMDSCPSEEEWIKLYEELSALWGPQVCVPESGFPTQNKYFKRYLKRTGLRSGLRQRKFAFNENAWCVVVS